MAKNIFSTILGLSETTEIKDIALSDITSNSQQPREVFDEAALRGLAESIRDVGVIQPVIVRREGKKYELVVGERRLRAARRAGLRKIPAIVRDTAPDASVRLALVENLQRENLSLIEEARAFQYLKDHLKLSQTEIARFVGRSQPLVSNTMRLLKLPAEVQRLVADGRVNRGQARALLKIEDREQQLALAKKLQQEQIHTADLERIIGGRAAASSALRAPLHTLKSILHELRRHGAAVNTAEREDDAARTLTITLKIPKK